MPRRAAAILRMACAALAVVFLALYFVLALRRLSYPFELEWMEGGVVDHVRRILAGQPIYGPPSVDFVAFFYPPVYYALGAAVSTVTGVGFLPLRLLSLLASIAVFGLLFALVRRECGSATAGLIAAGLFAATYARLGFWFDLARADTLYLAWLLAAALILRTMSGARGAVAAGACMAAALLTKQAAVVPFAAIAAWIVLADRRRAAWFVGAAVAVAAPAIVILNATTSGWFWYYCFTLPSRHPQAVSWMAFWPHDMVRPLSAAGIVSAVYAVTVVRRRAGIDSLFTLCLAAGLIASSWWIRTRLGADVNDLFAAYAAVALTTALGLETAKGLTAAAVLLQFVLLWYNPAKAIPTAADRAAGEQLVSRIARTDGDVFVPHHGYLAILAGKRAFAHTLAMDQVFGNDPGPLSRELSSDLARVLDERRVAAVLMEGDRRYEDMIVRNYPRCERLFQSRDPAFIPVSGAPLRPEFFCTK